LGQAADFGSISWLWKQEEQLITTVQMVKWTTNGRLSMLKCTDSTANLCPITWYWLINKFPVNTRFLNWKLWHAWKDIWPRTGEGKHPEGHKCVLVCPCYILYIPAHCDLQQYATVKRHTKTFLGHQSCCSSGSLKPPPGSPCTWMWQTLGIPPHYVSYLCSSCRKETIALQSQD